jgi:hypothetical protein
MRSDSWLEALFLDEVARVTTLQLGDGEDLVVAVHLKLVCGLTADLRPAEPRVPFAERQSRFVQNELSRLAERRVAAPSEG